jgi:hypothetical protein
MIVETIIMKNKVTRLEIVAHYSGDFHYGLSIGESCYSAVIEYDGLEYVVCINKSYDDIYREAENVTDLIGYPLVVNRVTRKREGYEIVRDSVCVAAYNRSLNKRKDRDIEQLIIENRSDLFDEYEIDFSNTERNWDADKNK